MTFVCRLVALTVFATLASTSSGSPRLLGKTDDPGCKATLVMAEDAFRSTNASLDWPIAEPRHGLRVVLRQNAEDISGGQAVQAEARVFSAVRREHDGYVDQMFWSRITPGSKRLVIVDSPSGWQGDRYTVYLLNAAMDQARFRQSLSEAGPARSLQPIVNEQWKIPIILANPDSSRLWVIDRGQPFETMPPWRIHAIDGAGHQQPCRIEFGTEDDALKLLPTAVRRYAALLDEALGPGTDEGTLRPTARIRIAVAKAWANAALRPWALTNDPYNNSAEVKAGLDIWAAGNAARSSLLRRIEKGRPAAERAMTAHYRSGFTSSAAKAQTMSRHTIDWMSRSYFVFPK